MKHSVCLEIMKQPQNVHVYQFHFYVFHAVNIFGSSNLEDLMNKFKEKIDYQLLKNYK